MGLKELLDGKRINVRLTDNRGRHQDIDLNFDQFCEYLVEHNMGISLLEGKEMCIYQLNKRYEV